MAHEGMGGMGRIFFLLAMMAAALFAAPAAAAPGDAEYEKGRAYFLGNGVLTNGPKSRAWMEKACALGHVKACDEIAIYVEPEAKRYEFLAKNCDRGYYPSCSSAAMLTAHQFSFRYDKDKKDFARTLGLAQPACDRGEAQACAIIASIHYSENGPLKGTESQAAAWAYSEKACRLGWEGGCDQLAQLRNPSEDKKVAEQRAQNARLEACNRNIAAACVYAAEAEIYKLYTPGANELSIPLYSKACELGHSRACRNAADQLARRDDAQIDRARIAALLDRSCTLDALSCDSIAQQYGYSSPSSAYKVADAKTRSLSFAERACNGGYIKSCTALAARYEKGDGVTLDLTRALALLDKACTGEDFEQCNRLGVIYSAGSPIPKDFVKANGYFNRSCAEQIWESCTQLAISHYSGEGVPVNKVLAASLAEQACTKNWAPACGLSGTIMFNGDVGTANKSQGIALWQKACAVQADPAAAPAGYRLTGANPAYDACANLGLQYASGTHVQQNAALAYAYSDFACRGNIGGGCRVVGLIELGNTQDPQAKTYAKAYFDAGCKLGDQPSCAEAAKLP